MQIGDEITQLFEIFTRKQRLAFDDDEHVEFGRGEALGFGFVLSIFLGIGSEQLTEGIIDLDSLNAEDCTDDQRQENDAGQDRRLDRDQAYPFQPERNARRRPLLDLLDVDLPVAVLFEHALSSPHIRSICIASNRGRESGFFRASAISAKP